MKNTFLFRTLSLFIVFSLLLSGFSGTPRVRAAEAVPVTGIKLNIQSCTIDTASSVKLIASVQPTNATNKEVLWTTDNPAVARVTNGIVRGYSEGTTVIKASTRDQGKAAYCIVTVKRSSNPTPIINVRADDDENGLPDFIISTEPFTIEGRVSADFRILANNILAGNIYVQDSTAGIAVNGVTKELVPGTKVKLTGTIRYDEGETQFQASNVEIISTAIEAVKPAVLSTWDSMQETKEGMLVKIQGKVTKALQGTIYVNDSSNTENEARIIIGGYYSTNSTSSLSAGNPPTLIIGDTVSVTGVASQDGAGHKIIIRNAKDISIVTEQDDENDEDDEEDENDKGWNSIVGLNKHSIVIKAGKFEHVNILTKPGNAVITSIKVKTKSPIVTISQDKKNRRLIRIAPNNNIKETSQKLEIEVVVNGKKYTLTLDVTIIGNKSKPSGKWHK